MTAMSQPASSNSDGFARERGVIIANSQTNVRLALALLEIALSHNVFSDRLLWAEGAGRPQLLDDAAMDRLWLRIDIEFHFRPSKEFFVTLIRDAARQNPFHPVKDYLAGLVWDRTPRLCDWLHVFGKADQTEYIRAVGQLVLVAAVRRVLQPGVKFDEMLVLEGPQGIGQKSSAIAALCPEPDWFSDDLPLNVDSKEVIERTSGRWIMEAAELSGMRRGEVEHLKAFLSRGTDVARLAYDRVPSERKRHFIVIGTTNSDTYLKDLTGNRRFWPVKVTSFDLAALIRDRDQLWAEAVAVEASGASIRLASELWPEATKQQNKRRVTDPWEEELGDLFGNGNGKILIKQVWGFVGLSDPSHRTQEQNGRLGSIMKRLGFQRVKARTPDTKSKGGSITRGRLAWHYARGTKEERANQLKVIM
jgi:hypothetical protein